MAGESNVRFYDNNGERISHTLKAAFKDADLPKYVWDTEDTERYRKLTTGDVFDNDQQVIIPSHAIPARLLTKERFWEALTDENGKQVAFPSVTQLHNVLANDGVVNWKINNVIEFFMTHIKTMRANIAYLNTNLHGENWADDGLEIPEEDIMQQYRDGALEAASPSEAAERGSRFHSAMELHLKGEDWGAVLEDNEIEPCRKIIAKIDEEMFKRHGKGFNPDIERQFVNLEQGVGGTADLAYEATVYDYKFSDKEVFGKRGGILKSKWCFPDRALQLAAYADGIGVEKPTLCNIFCNVYTGDVGFYEWPDPQRWLYAARLLNMFFYMFKLGRFPELGDNTAMIMHALEEWKL